MSIGRDEEQNQKDLKVSSSRSQDQPVKVYRPFLPGQSAVSVTSERGIFGKVACFGQNKPAVLA